MKGLLEDVRIIDLTRYVSGPFCGMMLAEMGAEVIKIEKPGGEDNRVNGPWKNGVGLLYPSCNLSKKGITLDLYTAEGKKILTDLIKVSDVLIENFRPGVMEKMGFSYQAVKELNPKIIMVSISGFGQTGPYRDRVCFDGIAQAVGGMIDSIWESGGVHCTTGGNFGDIFTGVYAATALCAALYHREQTQQGDYIDVDMASSILTLFSPKIANYAANGVIHPSYGYGPVANYKTTDGYVRIDATTSAIFYRLQHIIPDKRLANAKYHDVQIRLADNELLVGIIQRWITGRSNKEVEEIFRKEGIPIGVIKDAKMMYEDEQFQDRHQFVDVSLGPDGDTVPFCALPFRTQNSTMTYKTAPDVGEDNEEILHNVLRMSPEEIQKLKNKNII